MTDKHTQSLFCEDREIAFHEYGLTMRDVHDWRAEAWEHRDERDSARVLALADLLIRLYSGNRHDARRQESAFDGLPAEVGDPAPTPHHGVASDQGSRSSSRETAPDRRAAHTDQEYALMEALREALESLPEGTLEIEVDHGHYRASLNTEDTLVSGAAKPVLTDALVSLVEILS